MNLLKQIWVAYRANRFSKRIAPLVKKALKEKSVEILRESTLTFLHNDNQKYSSKKVYPFLRKALYKQYKEALKYLPYSPNQQWILSKERYFQLKGLGLLVDEDEPSKYLGKWLTSVTNTQVYKGKRYAEYETAFTFSDTEFTPVTFLVNETYKSGGVATTGSEGFQISTCRLATPEEIELAQKRDLEIEKLQKKLEELQKKSGELQQKSNILSQQIYKLRPW